MTLLDNIPPGLLLILGAIVLLLLPATVRKAGAIALAGLNPDPRQSPARVHES